MSLKLPYTLACPPEMNSIALHKISFHVLAIRFEFHMRQIFFNATYQGGSAENRRASPSGSDWRRAGRSWQRGASWRAVFPRVGGARLGRAKQPFEFCRRPHVGADASIACETAVGTPRRAPARRTYTHSARTARPARALGWLGATSLARAYAPNAGGARPASGAFEAHPWAQVGHCV